MRTATAFLCALLFLLVPGVSAAKPPRAELLGISLGMPEDEAHERLVRIGTLSPGPTHERESEAQASWTLRAGPWAYVALGLHDNQVAWVTAFARPKGHRVRYRDLGSLAECQRSGAYFFIWRVPARGSQPAYKVIARGTDSLYVDSVSLAPEGAGAHDHEETGHETH